MAFDMNRRKFVKDTLLTSTALGLALESSGANKPANPSKEAPTSELGMGKIGNLNVSRLMLGGNLLTHFTHSRELKYVYNLAAHYNTDEKIMETLAEAEKHGINTLSIHNPPHPISVLRRYRKERGGKIQWIVCPTAQVTADLSEYKKQVEELMADKCEAIYLWGVRADSLVAQNQIDLIQKAVELAKQYGVPSGVGGHDLEVVKACERYGIAADFYIKTFHHHSYPSGPKPEQLVKPYNENPGYWCRSPQETIDFMKTVKKPWIAFKTMAAGAIPPKQAFRYAYLNGADFVLAGMFDFEIGEDVKIAKEAMVGTTKRDRPWMA